MSTDLQWLLLRKNNSFIVKRVPEGPIFSKEPGNLRNLHSQKFSGLANSKTIDIKDTGSGVHITTRRKDVSPHASKKAFSTSAIRNRSSSRRALGVTSNYAKRGYRPDLRTAALARVSALLSAQRPVKPTPKKKLRGKKAQAAKAKEAAKEE